MRLGHGRRRTGHHYGKQSFPHGDGWRERTLRRAMFQNSHHETGRVGRDGKLSACSFTLVAKTVVEQV